MCRCMSGLFLRCLYALPPSFLLPVNAPTPTNRPARPDQVLFYGLMRQKRQEADDRLPVYLAPSSSAAGGGGAAGRDHTW